MKVIVLGAGVIGVTTAYYLARKGADVLVLDRQRAAGLETSFANAGELSYGMTSPWAAPDPPSPVQPDHVGVVHPPDHELQFGGLQNQQKPHGANFKL